MFPEWVYTDLTDIEKEKYFIREMWKIKESKPFPATSVPTCLDMHLHTFWSKTNIQTV